MMKRKQHVLSVIVLLYSYCKQHLYLSGLRYCSQYRQSIRSLCALKERQLEFVYVLSHHHFYH